MIAHLSRKRPSAELIDVMTQNFCLSRTTSYQELLQSRWWWCCVFLLDHCRGTYWKNPWSTIPHSTSWFFIGQDLCQMKDYSLENMVSAFLRETLSNPALNALHKPRNVLKASSPPPIVLGVHKIDTSTIEWRSQEPRFVSIFGCWKYQAETLVGWHLSVGLNTMLQASAC